MQRVRVEGTSCAAPSVETFSGMLMSQLHVCARVCELCFPRDKVMMIQNIAVDQRFANGTQGRLLHWHPSATQSRGKALPAYCQELLGRFCKESALSKKELMPGGCSCFLFAVMRERSRD